jgi:putative membrane-bound dehydrogenase-like protein
LVRARADQVVPAHDAPQPLPPEESLRRFQLPLGFRIELVAGEPHVADPVAMCVDARGRIFVCEIHGYNLEGYLDVLELNKTGVLDKAVRRIPANPKALEEAAKDQYGTVKLLEDADGDGRVDRSVVWADRLPSCYGVVAARDGVIVLCAPDIVYLGDADGDGKPEVRETLFTGFGVYEMWSRINNPRCGVDNWIYAASGIQSGGTIQGPRLPHPVRLGATCFRFKSDGTAIEPVGGNTSGFGLALDDWGDRFLVTNQQHALLAAPLSYHYLARNPYYAAPQLVLNISGYGHPAKVFPASQPDPWRLARSKDPAWVKFYGAAEATASGYFTAASGQTIYRADRFPLEYRGNHFSVDNAQNLVHRCLLEPDGVLYRAKRPTEDERTEFLTSSEQWFRPVNLMIGPDGALYVVDMYRAIIEDYSAIPRFLQQLYIESLVAGADRGRIWRVVPDDGRKSPAVDLSSAPVDRLVRELANGNAWWRHTAQRLLVERRDTRAVGPLEDLVLAGPTPQARLHSLYTIDGLGTLRSGLVERALGDAHFAVRMHAVRLSERWLDGQAELLDAIVSLASDVHPRVRLQVALSLGESGSDRALAALATLAVTDGDDPWIRAAILSSASETADRLARTILESDDPPGKSRQLLHPLASIVGARHDDESIGRLLMAVAASSEEQDTADRVDCLKGLIEGLGRGKASALQSDAGRMALERLLVSPQAEVSELALQVAGILKLEQSQAMERTFAQAADVAIDASRSVEARQAALGLLTAASDALLLSTAGKLLDARQPLDLQLSAVAALSSSGEPQVVSVLLTGWESYTPKVRSAVIDAVFRRQNRLKGLLDAVAAGRVQPSSLEALRRAQLLENPVPKIRQRAEALLSRGNVRADRQAVMDRFRSALDGPRDTKHGKAVYDKQCAKCHRLREEGHQVGPDLAAANNRPDETLLSDVLDPNNQITVGYRNYTVITEDGRIFTGVLAAETATSVTLRKEEAVEEVLLRKDIDEMAASTLSMMPEELEKEVSPQDIADLIAYLREVLGPVPPAAVTLFDDERSFADLLTEGDGTARIALDQPLSGDACLVVTPPQRWNLRIPGWQYRITENPGPDEYRYMRFAWKCPGGQGVMIELAGDGRWPPAEKPLRRYYAGKNTTGWAAVQVAEEPPAEWIVVTRDLWRDFGPFILTGIAPTAMGGEALFDRIELLRSLDETNLGQLPTKQAAPIGHRQE